MCLSLEANHREWSSAPIRGQTSLDPGSCKRKRLNAKESAFLWSAFFTCSVLRKIIYFDVLFVCCVSLFDAKSKTKNECESMQ